MNRDDVVGKHLNKSCKASQVKNSEIERREAVEGRETVGEQRTRKLRGSLESLRGAIRKKVSLMEKAGGSTFKR